MLNSGKELKAVLNMLVIYFCCYCSTLHCNLFMPILAVFSVTSKQLNYKVVLEMKSGQKKTMRCYIYGDYMNITVSFFGIIINCTATCLCL